MTLAPASVVCFLSLAATAEVIPLDDVQRFLESAAVGQSQRVVIGEDGTQWILEEVGPDVRTERVVQRSGTEMPLPTPNARYLLLS